MLMLFQFYKLGLRWGRGLWVSTSLAAGLFCVSCERAGEVAAPEVEVPAATTNMVSTSAEPEPDVDTGVDIQEMLRRVKAAGAKLRAHREALLAANEEMAAVFQEGLGEDAAAKAARAKLTAFYQTDAEGMALEEAFEAEKVLMKKVLERMPKTPDGVAAGTTNAPGRSSIGMRRGHLQNGMRSASSGGLEKRVKEK